VPASADGAAQFAMSRTGTIAYASAPADAESRRLVVRDGADQTPLAAPPRGYFAPRVSPDGRRILLAIVDESEHVWVYDVASSTLKQLTFEGSNRAAIWTPDGERVTFASNRNGALNLFVAPVDNMAGAERLHASDHLQLPGSWSPDGDVLAYVEHRPGTGRDIWLLRRGTAPIAWAQGTFDESAPRFSPNGRWIAYVSNESGRAEVVVRATNTASPVRQISSDGGTEPVWARDGHTLFYRAPRALVAAPVIDVAALRFGAAREVFPVEEPGSRDGANYDVMSSAGRVVMVASDAAQTASKDIHVIVNWNPSAP
jgi:serine/threonine-protein kinase